MSDLVWKHQKTTLPIRNVEELRDALTAFTPVFCKRSLNPNTVRPMTQVHEYDPNKNFVNLAQQVAFLISTSDMLELRPQLGWDGTTGCRLVRFCGGKMAKSKLLFAVEPFKNNPQKPWEDFKFKRYAKTPHSDIWKLTAATVPALTCDQMEQDKIRVADRRPGSYKEFANRHGLECDDEGNVRKKGTSKKKCVSKTKGSKKAIRRVDSDDESGDETESDSEQSDDEDSDDEDEEEAPAPKKVSGRKPAVKKASATKKNSSKKVSASKKTVAPKGKGPAAKGRASIAKIDSDYDSNDDSDYAPASDDEDDEDDLDFLVDEEPVSKKRVPPKKVSAPKRASVPKKKAALPKRVSAPKEKAPLKRAPAPKEKAPPTRAVGKSAQTKDWTKHRVRANMRWTKDELDSPIMDWRDEYIAKQKAPKTTGRYNLRSHWNK